MVLELHVWGPAFSLPSIDAQCIAAIAYMTQAVPRGEWILVASSNPSLSPTNELPVLRNENVWIGGFRNIVDYVMKFSGRVWSLDADLDGMEKADCIAFSSFVEAHGQTLLDLSLYVSTQNYTTVTRPLYSSIQPFPLAYITPSSIRSVAKSRTSHLGLSSLDIDSDSTAPTVSEKESIIPASLRKPRTTITSLLSQNPENAAQIRLDALATSFFEPLQSLRGKKRFFITHFLTTLDCLALGYLSLALLPDLPSPWLANCMRTKYPQLCAFVHDLQRSYFNSAVTLEDAYLTSPSSLPPEEAEKERERRRRANGKAALPWAPYDRGGLIAIGSILASNMVDSIPVVSQLRHATKLKQELESQVEDELERQGAEEAVSIYKRELWTTTASIVGGVVLLVGHMAYYGLLTRLLFGEERQGRRVAAGARDGQGDGGQRNSTDEKGGVGAGEDNRTEGRTEMESGSGSGLGRFGEAGAALEVLAQDLNQQMGEAGVQSGGPPRPPAPIE